MSELFLKQRLSMKFHLSSDLCFECTQVLPELHGVNSKHYLFQPFITYETENNNWETSKTNQEITFSNGYLGSCNDEERSEMRYVMRIAELSESSNL